MKTIKGRGLLRQGFFVFAQYSSALTRLLLKGVMLWKRLKTDVNLKILSTF